MPTFTTYIMRNEGERNETEVEVAVTYTCTPFIAATHEQPAEGGEVEITSAIEASDDPLTEDELERIYDDACGRAQSDMAEEDADRQDYMAEQARDRRMDAEMGL